MADEVETGSGGLVPIAVGAKLLMLSPERVGQFVKMGYIPAPQKRGFYSLVGLVQGYIRFLKDEERSRSRVAVESGVKKAREIEIMQRVGERAGRLIETSEAAEALDDVVGMFVAELDSLPASFTRDLKTRRALQGKLDGIRSRLLTRLDEKIVSLRTGSAAADAEEETDP